MSHTTRPPARLRLIIEGEDRLPTITRHLAALADATSAAGLAPSDLHPVVHLLLRQAAVIDAPNRGWNRSLAEELAAEQAAEYRDLGLAYQLEMIFEGLGRDAADFEYVMRSLFLGRPEDALLHLALPGMDLNPKQACAANRAGARRVC